VANQAIILREIASPLTSVVFDVFENESHKATAKVTDHPVESGAQVSDHVMQEPDTLDLVARVSNTPIVRAEERGDGIPDHLRVDQAYAALMVMKRAGEPVTVATSLRFYQEMVITSVTITRDASTGDALAVSLSLREIRTATSKTVKARTPKKSSPRAQSPVEIGTTTTEPTPPVVTERAETMLKKGGSAVFGLFKVRIPKR
jgi:hypothetical protein